MATETRIRDTADLSKAAIAACHHPERLQRDVYNEPSPQSEPTSTAAPLPVDPTLGDQLDFQKAHVHREHYLAKMAEMEFCKAQGSLVEVSVVQKGAFQVARMLNESLLGMSPHLAPQLAAMSYSWEIERHLTAALRQRLGEAA
ncbi:terminase small subunit [Pseudomonas frederiksbergensis]|uniref:terminase small subunit n=1 Tax=Pseudomonas frederiksbergensis TaxID=104087 RepID=UPI003D203C2C